MQEVRKSGSQEVRKSGSQEGARALCLHFSLIRSAKLHKLDPYQYYVEIMKAIPHCDTAEDYEVLLPWNIDLVKVKNNDQHACALS